MTPEERIANLEHAFLALKRLAENSDARMDSTDQRVDVIADHMVALVDAQVRTETTLAVLSERMSELAAAQVHTDQRLDALIDIVREGRNGKAE